MSEAASKFTCNACGKQYTWKTELAGRKAKCKCGSTMDIPKEDPTLIPVASEPESDGLYDLADIAASIAPAGAIEAAQAAPVAPKLAVAVATPAKGAAKGKSAAPAQGKILGYSGPRPTAEADDSNDNQIQELYAPIGIFVAGVILSLIQMTHFNRITLSIDTALFALGIRLIVDMVLISLGCLAAMRILEISFGNPGTAILKIAAIAVFGPPIGQIISYVLHDPFGFVGASIAMGIIWIMFVKLFDMEINDVMYLSVIVWGVRMWLGYALIAFLLSGSGIPGIVPMSGPSLKPSAFAVNSDRAARDTLDLGRTVDAKPWLQDGGSHLLGNVPNGYCVKFVDALIAAGCKNPQAVKDGGVADQIIAELPSDPEQRKKAFAAAVVIGKVYGDTPPTDLGQTYLVMNFGASPPPPPRRGS